MRSYKKKKIVDPDRRMAVAVRLRAEGLSLRQIAARQYVHHQTVARDLARWETEHHRMPLSIIRLSLPGVANVPPRGKDATPGCDTGADVIQFRRTS